MCHHSHLFLYVLVKLCYMILLENLLMVQVSPSCFIQCSQLLHPSLSLHCLQSDYNTTSLHAKTIPPLFCSFLIDCFHSLSQSYLALWSASFCSSFSTSLFLCCSASRSISCCLCQASSSCLRCSVNLSSSRALCLRRK